MLPTLAGPDRNTLEEKGLRLWTSVPVSTVDHRWRGDVTSDSAAIPAECVPQSSASDTSGLAYETHELEAELHGVDGSSNLWKLAEGLVKILPGAARTNP